MTFGTELHDPSNQMVPLFTVLQKKPRVKSKCCKTRTEKGCVGILFLRFFIPRKQVLAACLNASIRSIEGRLFKKLYTVKWGNKEKSWKTKKGLA